MIIGSQLRIIGYLFCSIHSFCQEKIHFTINTEILSTVIRHIGSRPIIISRYTSASFMILFKSGFKQGYSRFKQQSRLSIDTLTIELASTC